MPDFEQVADTLQTGSNATFEQEIEKILNKQVDCGGYYVDEQDKVKIKLIISLIQSTVKGCVPERRDVCAWEDAMERDEFQDLGFNNAIDTITSNLQKVGLI